MSTAQFSFATRVNDLTADYVRAIKARRKAMDKVQEAKKDFVRDRRLRELVAYRFTAQAARRKLQQELLKHGVIDTNAVCADVVREHDKGPLAKGKK